MSKSSQAFRTIREVADWLDVAAHVLRFWESKFSQIKPVKRAGGRRYYRPADMELVGGIKVLLHDRGLTIRGVQKLISDEGIEAVTRLSPPIDTLLGEDVIEAGSVEDWTRDAGEETIADPTPAPIQEPLALEPVRAETEPEPEASDASAPAPAATAPSASTAAVSALVSQLMERSTAGRSDSERRRKLATARPALTALRERMERDPQKDTL